VRAVGGVLRQVHQVADPRGRESRPIGRDERPAGVERLVRARRLHNAQRCGESAAVAEFSATANGASVNAAKTASKALVRGPVVS
jgi:hypothetical protein